MKELKDAGLASFWGDACLYLGMFVAAGWTKVEDAFFSCLDAEGRLWRNPDESREGTSPYSHGTSKDMLAGFILGCIASPERGRKALPKLAAYLRKHGKLAPSGDDRTHLRPGTWADLGEALEFLGVNVFKTLGLKNWLLWKLLRHGKSLENYVSALTVWKDYQLHLILVSLITKKKLGKKFTKLDKRTLKVLDTRLKQNAVVKYLLGDKEWLTSELPHMYNRASRSSMPFVWPWAYGSFVIGSYHMPRVAVEYMEYLIHDLK